MIAGANSALWTRILRDETRIEEGVIPVATSFDAPAMRKRLLHSGVSEAQLSDLSELFLKDRISAWSDLYAPTASLPDLALAYAPVAEAAVNYGKSRKQPFLLITLGMHELLRYHGVISIFAGSSLVAEHKAALQPREIDLVRSYLNLASILFLCGHGPLPRIDAELPEPMLQSGYRLAEGAMLFLVLHEAGHVVWDGLCESGRQTFSDRIAGLGFRDLPPNHVKEIFCDNAVFDHVPENATGAMIIASQCLLNLENFCAAQGLRRSGSHPDAATRYSAMMRLQELDDEWRASVDKAIGSARSVAGKPAKTPLDIPQLHDLQRRLDEGFPWQISVARLLALRDGARPPDPYMDETLVDEVQKIIR